MQDDVQPFITVTVCTRNRGAPLADMLQSLIEMDQPQDEWELVVVDNGSTDETPAVIRDFHDRLPLRTVREETPGLSYARNRGIAEARGEYIIWTDDDVRVHRAWLSAYEKAFRTYPDASYFGGRINPVFEGRAPAWLSQNLEKLGSAFARRELGDTTRPFTDRRGDNPFGANFAVRTREQRELQYPEFLGVSPQFRRVGEETFVIRGLRHSGKTGYWVPEAGVDHIIPKSRQSLDYILAYRRAAGETWAVLSEKPEEENFMGVSLADHSRRIAGAPVWIWRMTAQSWLKYRWSRLSGPSSRWIPGLMEYGYYRGALDYLRKA